MSEPLFRTVNPADFNRCYEIESTAYEGDEAGTAENIAKRINNYPNGFIVMEIDGQVAGFINSGCAHEVLMSNDEFKELIGHHPNAPNVVIMSVVIHKDYQGRGLFTPLMNAFIERMHLQGKETINLMCKFKHIGLYAKNGFKYVKPSKSQHGGVEWHEMNMELTSLGLEGAKFGIEHKLDFKKEVYSQTQSWARHHETLILTINTVVLGALAVIWQDLLKDQSIKYPMHLMRLFSLLGFLITSYLWNQYRDAIKRIVIYERYFGMHEKEKSRFNKNIFLGFKSSLEKGWGDEFVPSYLNKSPGLRPYTGSFLMGIYLVIFALGSWAVHSHFNESSL